MGCSTIADFDASVSITFAWLVIAATAGTELSLNDGFVIVAGTNSFVVDVEVFAVWSLYKAIFLDNTTKKSTRFKVITNSREETTSERYIYFTY